MCGAPNLLKRTQVPPFLLALLVVTRMPDRPALTMAARPSSCSDISTTCSSNYAWFPHALPTAVLEQIAAFLLGTELFALSHASGDALTLFSQDHLWISRLSAFTGETFPASSLDATRSGTSSSLRKVFSKQRYIRESRSFSFPGRLRDAIGSPEANVGAFIPVQPSMRDAFGSWGSPFSFETCFSLPLEEDTMHTGGVVFGAQSIRLDAETPASVRPDTFAQFVYVDSQRNLFCSVIKAFLPDTPIALALEPGRWYHLALVYAHQCECVSLNGEAVRTEIGRLPAKWRALYAGQVGIGFVNASSVEVATASALEGVGWRGFHGVVDSFRVYRSIRSPKLTTQFAGALFTGDSGGIDENADERNIIGGQTAGGTVASFCLRRDAGDACTVLRVRCSRPQERWCQLATTTPQSESQDANALDELIDAI